MIKPEDIDNVVAEKVLRDGLRMSFPNTMVSAILNAAIEAGVVSPPCWEVVGEHGRPFMVFKDKKAAEAWASWATSIAACEVQHWKGQTE